jgi:hypothetical protein
VATHAIALPALLAAWTLLPYLSLRPQVISWLLMAVLLAWLMLLDASSRWWRPGLIGLPLLIGLWANLHGLWVVGLAVIGLYTLFTLVGRTPMAPVRRWMLAAAVVSCLAAALTPAGPAGLLYPLRYLDPGSWALRWVSEWGSPNFHDPAHWPLIVLIGAVALNRGRATPGWLAALAVIGAVLGVLSMRNVPVFAIWAIPTLAIGLDARIRGPEPGRRRRSRGEAGPFARRAIELLAATAVIVGALTLLLPRDLNARIADDVERANPVEGVDALLAADPAPRVLADYGWAGWVITRIHPSGGLVFVDGRDGEMYSQELLYDYTDLVLAADGWQELLDRYAPTAILLRPDAPLVHGLAQSVGWCEEYRDAKQVLLLPCA